MILKTYFRILLLSFLFFLGACKESFVDLKPINSYTSQNFWENEVQIETALNSIYPIIRGRYHNDIWKVGEFASDNTTFQYNPADRGGTALEEMDYFLSLPNNGVISSIYNNCYAGIARANYLLLNLPDAVFTNEENRSLREAETRFLRSFFYHLLVIHFGDVPLTLQPITDEAEAIAIRRSPVSDIYAQAIIPDLNFAIETLPLTWNSSNVGRATKGAAQMLLAKAYFAQKNYTDALPLLQDIINSNQYALMPDYRDVFDPAYKNNEEIIYDAQFDAGLMQASNFMVGWLPFNSGSEITEEVVPGTGAGRNIPTQDMLNAYEAGDKRKEASVGFFVVDPATNEMVPYVRKFVFPPILTAGTDVNIPIFRYADALLMEAEAILETEGGIPDKVFQSINLLRSRAGLGLIFPGNPDPNLDIQTEEALREILRKERRVELAYESHRWYDLIRYGTLEETMRAHGVEQKASQSFLDPFPDAYMNIYELWAIPPNEVLQYGYIQNPGWN